MIEGSDQPIFIFDANFFIALKEIKAKRPYYQLAQARKSLNVQFYVSGAIFNECPFIVGKDFQEFSKGIEIALTTDNQLEGVKKDLSKNGVRMMAQDPDLTLVALGHQLKELNPKADVFVISDDFKLSQNIDTLLYRIKCLSLPAFLQFLGQNLQGKIRDFWKIIRKKVLQLNLDYMMSRSNIYAPQAKIAWFIENAVDISSGTAIHLKKVVDPDLKEQEEMDEAKEILQICEDFINNKRLPKEKKKRIEKFEPALKLIQKERGAIPEAQYFLMKSNFREALKVLNKTKQNLNEILQLYGAGKLREEDYQFFEKIMASEISKITFLRAFVLIEANKIGNAIKSLDDSALFSTIGRIPETVLTINYLKALLFIFNSYYSNSIAQFKFIHQLAENYGDETLELKAVIGEAVVLYLTDQKNEAVEQIQKAKARLTDKSTESLMGALLDSGDYFLAMGFPEIASNLFCVALECAIDAEKKWKYNLILSKMKMAYMASSLIEVDSRAGGDISVLIDQIHEIKNIDMFNELMMEIATFSNKLYEQLPYLKSHKKKISTYFDLPEEFKGEWQCVKIQVRKKAKHTLLIGFKEEIGLVAFDLATEQVFDGVPENYTLQIKRTANIKVEPPGSIKESLFLVRAIIRIDDEERDLEIKREIPIVFKQMRID